MGWLLLATLLLPGALAMAALWSPLRATALRLAPWAPAPALLAALCLPMGTALHLPWLFLGSSWSLDATARVFLGVTALVYLASGWFAWGYFAPPAHERVSGPPSLTDARPRFLPWFLASMTGNLALIPAQDPVTYLVFFGVMSFAAYGLIIFQGTPTVLTAGRMYLGLAVAGETAAFVGLVWACFATGGNKPFAEVALALSTLPEQPIVVLMLLLGFGVKLGIMPLHIWLPLAHPAAPTPASAVLSAVMLKTGLLLWLRLFPGAIPPLWVAVLLIAGIGSLLLAALIGMTQSNPKSLLAYSSISQMGLAALLLGLLSGVAAGPTGSVPADRFDLLTGGVLLLVVHHALAKASLFLGVGLIFSPLPTGLRRLVLTGLALSGAALAGVPATGGHLAKGIAKWGVQGLPELWVSWLGWGLFLSGLTTMLLVVRLLRDLAAIPEPSGSPHPGSRPMLAAWGTLTVGVAALPVAVLASGWFDAEVLGWSVGGATKAALPSVLALALAWLWVRVPVPPWIRSVQIPAGDLALPLSIVGSLLILAFQKGIAKPVEGARDACRQLAMRVWRTEGTLLDSLAQQESYSLGMILMLMLALGVALLL